MEKILIGNSVVSRLGDWHFSSSRLNNCHGKVISLKGTGIDSAPVTHKSYFSQIGKLLSFGGKKSISIRKPLDRVALAISCMSNHCKQLTGISLLTQSSAWGAVSCQGRWTALVIGMSLVILVFLQYSFFLTALSLTGQICDTLKNQMLSLLSLFFFSYYGILIRMCGLLLYQFVSKTKFHFSSKIFSPQTQIIYQYWINSGIIFW